MAVLEARRNVICLSPTVSGLLSGSVKTGSLSETELVDADGEINELRKVLEKAENGLKEVLKAKYAGEARSKLDGVTLLGGRYEVCVKHTMQERFDTEKAKRFLTPEELRECVKVIEFATVLAHKRELAP